MVGESGSDNEKQLVHGSKLFLDSLHKYPAVVIFPQCPETDYWSNIDRIAKDDGTAPIQFPNRPSADTFSGCGDGPGEPGTTKPYIEVNRFYVTGMSMGGMGTLELCGACRKRSPQRKVPICGGRSGKGSAMVDVPIWIFHGMKDDVVPPAFHPHAESYPAEEV